VNMKSFVLAGVLAVSTLSIASAKTYEITLATQSKAGNVPLKAGQYRLKVEGSNATFVNVENGKTATAPVKVVSTDKKFETTTVDASKEGDTSLIKDIELGGSKTKLEF
jgi:VCBS repeat-containing protein